MVPLCFSSLPTHSPHIPSFSSPSRSSVSFLPSYRSQLNRFSTRLHTSAPHSASFDTAVAVAAPNPTFITKTFDWYSHWYPLALLCDLDKRAPKALTVLGLDVVIWWDRVEGMWKVFDDRCPHRLAPLSEGRIDAKGRLQCVYHGWCFDGAGACNFIPQAPALGPPVHRNEKACVKVYPSIEQNQVLWFWPSTDPVFKDIINKKKPPYIPELDDPSFSPTMFARDVQYGYEILTENLVDPSHLPYAHYNIMDLRRREDPGRFETDIEGGSPLEFTIEKLDITGFEAGQDAGYYKFVAPCAFYFSILRNFSGRNPGSKEENSDEATRNEPRSITLLLCVPVKPGKSRVITITTRNFATWLDKFVPPWYYHMGNNIIIDSDLYLLHLEEQKLVSLGISNWPKVCYVPTQADAMVIAFRTWLRKYSGNRIRWTHADSAIPSLPPSPHREQLMDRYWSHVVHCKSCSEALRALKAIEVSLQGVSIAIIGILAAANHSINSNIAKATVVAVAVMCFVASRWLSQFIHKEFYYHDYNHATHRRTPTLLGSILGGL